MLNKTVFERYSVSAQIHENDLSILYAGKDTQTSQTIFITVIKSGIVPAADFLSRFRSMPQVNSALAVKQLEVGEVDGQAFIVWEGSESKSLADLTSDGIGLSLERCLELAGQLGSHLEAIHSQNLIQGVLLPEDIFLSDENALRILNVGVWNSISFDAPYRAPELVRGEQASVRSDIYSLGALLFKILTGQAPEADPFPSRARSDIPSDWDELVSRCLNLDPARRVQSAAEFIGKLDEIGHATKLGQGKLMGMEDSLVGHTLGAYRLVERLGQGGMATVYKAYEAALDRYVAVKVLPQFFANDPTFAQRFRREAKAIAQLNHPNIVPIYSYGEDNGITYIAMQFIEGGTLKHASDQVYRSEEALRLLLPIARALGYAHKHGVIHRDIKPSNVLISDEGWTHLADFGLAQMAQASARLTESGVGMGTPTYMSPEQGQGDRVDQRTDIYSFGIMLYELVTGEAPFRADTPMAVVIKHLTAPMPLPSDVNPDIPLEVEMLILKATAKNPDDRFQTAEELALAMERALNLPAVVKEERKADPSLPQYAATVAAHPRVPPAAPTKESRKPKRIFKTLGIAALLILGLPCLCVVGMYALNICPPEGNWDQPPWCAGSRYVVPFIDTPVVEMSPAPVTEIPPATPVITEGKLGNILFQDDFEGGISPRWMFTSSRYLVPWIADEFEGRTVFHSLPATSPSEITTAEVQEPTWDNYAIQFDFRFLKPDRFGTHYLSIRGRNAECSPTISARQGYGVTVSPDKSLLQKMICKEGGHEELKTSDWDLDPNTWHTLQYNLIGNRIQLLIDGKTFFDYTDQQDWLIGSDLWLETGPDAEVLFDNLRVYEIVSLSVAEDDLASQEPFSRAVGEWEATDLDKSHMTMAINRIATGQYTFLYIDELATFCDGGAGKAEFEADTFSNIATGTFEFVCDSIDRRGNVDYKLTYNNASDEIVDSYGVVWSRKK